MNLEEIIKRQKEEFKKVNFSEAWAEDSYKEIWYWHTQSIKEILEGVKQREIDEKEKYEPAYEEVDKAYIASKFDTINYLEEIVKSLND